MPRLFIDLAADEFTLLRDRAFAELRHPRAEARLIVREGLGLSRSLTLNDDEALPEPVPADAPQRKEPPEGRL